MTQKEFDILHVKMAKYALRSQDPPKSIIFIAEKLKLWSFHFAKPSQVRLISNSSNSVQTLQE